MADDALDEYEEFHVGDINLRQAALKDVYELQSKLRAAIKKRHTAETVQLKDKLSFCVGTCCCCLSAYYLGASPATFNRNVYSGAAVVLFALRLAIYRVKKWHYYALDFCYLANAVLLVHIWLAPSSRFLHIVTFAFGTGPLAWSIVAFQNSLVFHSLDKTTSLFLHLFPAVVAYTQRWHHDERTEELLRQQPGLTREWDSASLAELVLFPLVPYALWAFAYYAKVFIISEAKIQQKGYETLYKYLTRSPKSAVARVVRRAPPRWQPLAYMGLHVALTTASFALSKICWSRRDLHTAFLVGVFCWATWNGANYYFIIFARRYVAGLPKSGSETALAEEPAPTEAIVGTDPPPAGVLPAEMPAPSSKRAD